MCALCSWFLGRKYKVDSLGEIPSWLIIWGLINDAKLLQNLRFCLFIDHFKVVSIFCVIALNAHPK
jgi:hypothetical protein